MRSEARRRLLAIAGLAAALLLAPAAQALTYYVLTTGDDGDDGLTLGTAWQSIEQAGDTLVAGDVVYIGGGTYTDKVDVKNSGTAANPIRFVADTTGAFTGVPGPVVLSDGGDVFKVDGEDYVTILGIRTTGGKIGFKFKNADGIVLQDCESDGHDDRSVEVDNAEVQISGCDFHDNGKEGVRIKGNSNATLINVLIHDNDDEGIKLDNTNASLNLSRCDIYDNDKEGFLLKKGTAEVSNCVIRDNASHGIELDDNQANLDLWHSTIVGNSGDGIYQDKGDSVITNSIIASNGGDGLDLDDGSMTHDYNIVWNNGSQDYEGTGASGNESSVDPLFVGAADFHLQATSPAIDAGIDASAVTNVDRDGASRPQGLGWDLGAYESPVNPHFQIVHDGAAATCVVESITLRRHGPSHATDPGYTGTVTLSTSTAHGDWSLLAGAGTLVNAGSGGASYSFAAGDAGQVTLGLLNTFGETLSIDVTDGTRSEDPTEDPNLVVSGGGNDSYRDDFASVSYANQDGSLLWTGSWLEVDGAGAGPAAGNARIGGGELVLEDFANTDLDTAVRRQADLSAHASASFRFDFRTTFGVDSSDAVFIEVSGDGGVTWTVLERITGISGATSASRTYDITAFIASNTQVRFRVDGLNGTGGTSCCYGGANEEFRVAFAEIQVPAAAICGPDHFAISHDGSGIHCQAENVTFAAHDATHAVDTGFSGTLSLSTSTSHGDWSLVAGSGTLVNAGNGGATYSFVGADAGQVVLGLSNSFSETLNIDVSDGAASEAPAEDPDLPFASAGFSFLADGVASSLGSQIGAKPSNVAPGAQVLELEAIRTSDSSGACEAALQGVNPIELAFTCEDPTTCAAAQLSINGTPIAANPAGAPSSWTALNLDFGDATDSTAPFSLVYPDVGRLQLHARFVLAPSGEILSGASNAFGVRPFAFEVTATGNPGATNESGPIFTVAGTNFTANARAVLWQAADDAGADGIADGHDDADPLNNTNLADNATALSYGRESSVEGMQLAAALLEPMPGIDPGLGGTTLIPSPIAGVGSAAGVYFDEVGIAELAGSVPDGDYLGIGAAETARIAGRSSHVGRFRPDHFDVAVTTAPVLATGCAAGGFSYIGDSFLYATQPVLTVTARSSRNSLTRNYTDVWWKITNASLANRSYSADPAHLVALDPSGLPLSGADPVIAFGVGPNIGTGTLAFDLGTGLRFDRAGPVTPFDAEIALSIDVLDADGVAYTTNPFAIGAPSSGNGMAWSSGADQRYGRLKLSNAFGSELSDLPVPLRAEYWNGVAFIVNGDDSCSAVAVADVGTTATDPPGLVTNATLDNVPLVSGDAGLSFSAPNVDGWADVRVDLAGAGTDLPFLGWDWSGDGLGPSYDQNPSARLTFGIHAGQGPVIFRREVY